MKKILLLILLIAFIGCEKEEPKSELDIIGFWFVTETYIDNKWVTVDYDYKTHTEFRTDGKHILTVNDISSSGTYMISGNKITAEMGDNTLIYDIISIIGNVIEYTLTSINQPETKHLKAVRERYGLALD